MQTIRIYSRSGGLVARFSGAPNRVETKEMRERFPEGEYRWLR